MNNSEWNLMIYQANEVIVPQLVSCFEAINKLPWIVDRLSNSETAFIKNKQYSLTGYSVIDSIWVKFFLSCIWFYEAKGQYILHRTRVNFRVISLSRETLAKGKQQKLFHFCFPNVNEPENMDIRHFWELPFANLTQIQLI